MMRNHKRTPVFFNLLRIDVPLTAVVSFAHRLSGVFLSLAVPFVVYLLQRSLRSAQDYAWVVTLFDHALMQAVIVVTVWALAYHALAGLRHLLYDIDVGVSLSAARRSAWLVLLASLGAPLLAIGIFL